jgi:hypothetical protein
VDTEMGQPECRIVMTRDKKKEKRWGLWKGDFVTHIITEKMSSGFLQQWDEYTSQ